MMGDRFGGLWDLTPPLKTFELTTVCPHCARVNDLSSDGKGSTPSPGDLSICWTCKNASVFQEDLRLRKLTREEWAECGPHVEKMLSAAARANARGPSEALRAMGKIE